MLSSNFDVLNYFGKNFGQPVPHHNRRTSSNAVAQNTYRPYLIRELINTHFSGLSALQGDSVDSFSRN